MNCSGSSPCDDDVSRGLVEGSWFVTLIMTILILVREGRGGEGNVLVEVG